MHSRLSPGDRSIVERLIARERPAPSEVLLLLHEVEARRIRSLGVCSIQLTRDHIKRGTKHARFGLDPEVLLAVLVGQLTGLLDDEGAGSDVRKALFRHCWQLATCCSQVIGLRCPQPNRDAMSAMVLQLHPQFECDVLHVSIPRGRGHAGNAPYFEEGPSVRSAVILPFPKPKGA